MLCYRAVAAALTAAFFVVPADAQMLCGPRDALVAHLRTAFQEHRHAVALTGNGRLLEVFVAESGSWTIVVSQPDGPSCILSAGESWDVDRPAIPPRGRET